MPFEKGMKKPDGSGRKQGSLNKKKLLRVEEILTQRDINPTEEILKLLDHLTAAEQAKIWVQFLSYLEPKLATTVIKEESREPDRPLRDVPTEVIIAALKNNQIYKEKK